MTDLAQPAPTKRPSNPQPLTASVGLLKLKGNEPTTVYVRVINKVPEFSQDQVTWFPNGMKWHPGDEYELYITYVLVTAGIELKPSATAPDLWFSPIQNGLAQFQLGSVQPVPATKTYNFRIKIPGVNGSSDDYVDPEIIVTPANPGSNDD